VYIFIPKIPILVPFGWPWNRKFWFMYITTIWYFYGKFIYVLRLFGIFWGHFLSSFPNLVCRSINLAVLTVWVSLKLDSVICYEFVFFMKLSFFLPLWETPEFSAFPHPQKPRKPKKWETDGFIFLDQWIHSFRPMD
jgi:hypothetical protein